MNKVIKGKYYPKGGLFQAQAQNQASWLWKSWIGAKKILQKGVQYQVGDGKSIRIWEVPWIETTLNFMPQTQKPPNCRLTWISELIQPENRRWNSTLIHRLFNQENAATILQMPINRMGMKDKLIWTHTQNGYPSRRSVWIKGLRGAAPERWKERCGKGCEVYR